MKEINSQEFKDLVLNSQDKVLVDFSATRCGPCKMQRPVLEDMEADVDFKIYSIDVDENPDLAQTYNVNAVPSLLVFNQGQLKNKLIGFQAREVLEDAMAKA